MYFKAQSYHWNVEGPLFPMYHNFFGSIYEELYPSIDVFAEQLRMLGERAPSNLQSITRSSTIVEDETSVDMPHAMVQSLIDANQHVINSLNACYELADAVGEQGLVDIITNRMAEHKKHNWMLTSTLKGMDQ